MASLDLDAISSRAREGYIDLGTRFSSTSTFKQASRTLAALAEHGELLADHGFSQQDGVKLGDARDMLEEAGVGREAAITDRKTTSKKYVEAVKIGKQVRAQGISILGGAQDDLNERGGEDDLKAANAIQAVLEQTSLSGTSAQRLAEQNTLLLNVLAREGVAEVANARNGAAIVAMLQKSVERLRKVARERVFTPGTPEHTQLLDLLDGVIINLARRARKAARSAAKAKGDPAIAEAFKLSDLYG